MPTLENTTAPKTRRRHALRIACAVLALNLSLATGCDDDVADEFREAAANSLENGFKQIFDGLIEGAFAAFVVGTDGATGGGGSTATDTGSTAGDAGAAAGG